MADYSQISIDSSEVASKKKGPEVASHEMEPQPLHKASTKPHLALAFFIILAPMLAIPFLLMAFFLYSDIRPNLQEYTSDALPSYNDNIPTNMYFTTQTASHVLTVSGWASTVGQFLMAPFMLMFSFFIAKSLMNKRRQESDVLQHEYEEERDNLLQGMNKGAWQDLLNGFLRVLCRAARRDHLHVAAMGAAITGGFTLLLIATDQAMKFDNFLNNATLCLPIYVPNGIQLPGQRAALHDFDDQSWTTFVPSTGIDCATQDTCSLNTSVKPWSVIEATAAYYVLDLGDSEQTSGFGLDEDNALELQSSIDAGTASDIQTVQFDDKNRTHVFLFNVTAAGGFYQADGPFPPPEDKVDMSWGIDFTANTFSMTTDCVSATEACGMHNVVGNDTSLPFNCSSIFSGNATQEPGDGIERFGGWDSSFYDIAQNGSAVNMSLTEQLNPFRYNATSTISSIDYQTLEWVGDRQVPTREIVDAGNGRVAFALSCESTVWNVTFSMVEGNIVNWNAVPSEPWVANLMRLPLQVGLGRYDLFKAASVGALLNNNVTVAEAMGKAFSRVGIALASGAFDVEPSRFLRQRWVQPITGVYKASFWFMIVVCLLYAVVAIVVFSAALLLQRRADCRAEQQKLMGSDTTLLDLPNPKDLLKTCFTKGKELYE